MSIWLLGRIGFLEGEWADKRSIVTFLGRNGCGKSTLLKIVTGNLKPDVGQVEVAEKALSSFHTNEMARQVAFYRRCMKYLRI